MTSRVGIGYDIHAFGPGDHVMLAGVRVPHDKGVRAHSDGDVVIHALCDALLGAAGLGDIGQHFPDSDPRWKGAASSVFLKRVVEMVSERGYRIINADVTVLAESPRIGPHKEVMKKTVAQLLGIAGEAVNIKATTHEGLGALGRSEGLAAQAAVLVERSRT